jgi:membrane protein YdbS with pleckstrin-like domain
MFCSDCGAENKDTAAYCRKCGIGFEPEVLTRLSTRSEAEDETRFAAPRFGEGVPKQVVRLDPADRAPLQAVGSAVPPEAAHNQEEREIFSISPTLIFVKIGYVLSILGGLLLVALVSAVAGSWVSTSVAVIMALALLLIPAYRHLLTRFVRYTLTDRTLRIDEGLIARSARNVPLRRIQDVTVSSTVRQRLFGLGDLVVDNASEEGGKLVLRNIDDPRTHADKLLRQISMLDS